MVTPLTSEPAKATVHTFAAFNWVAPVWAVVTMYFAKLVAEPEAMAPATPCAAALPASVDKSINFGNAVAAKMPRITITTISSIRVKPCWVWVGFMLGLSDGIWRKSNKNQQPVVTTAVTTGAAPAATGSVYVNEQFAGVAAPAIWTVCTVAVPVTV
jgi:hypothetical protein